MSHIQKGFEKYCNTACQCKGIQPGECQIAWWIFNWLYYWDGGGNNCSLSPYSELLQCGSANANLKPYAAAAAANMVPEICKLCSFFCITALQIALNVQRLDTWTRVNTVCSIRQHQELPGNEFLYRLQLTWVTYSAESGHSSHRCQSTARVEVHVHMWASPIPAPHWLVQGLKE